ncbi:hypothetical protein SEENIN0B_04649 [Salmonella enterica subsp. enterica serovar Infantis str. SARB27]|uniref:Uncharacterized protein n=1 Tax=Salmonella enterica subsp. enterica serovar Infantis str. SARB27 TaxID=596155 RepID=A0A6C8G0G5_SALIN|nr:hypothetical protein SEENIN0B_04649 [Salmonella enterica subsp. enterica serovar Infantis str. SARB27]
MKSFLLHSALCSFFVLFGDLISIQTKIAKKCVQGLAAKWISRIMRLP